ncbi:hypothetical protein F4802DRAFT_171984 [Xylaria palmicola]|nr:hypothetical protein F4802DRAFT_171984 [Xylaria palmicola]
MAATLTPPLAALTTVFTPPCPTTWLLTTTKVPSQFPPFPTAAPASCDPPSWDGYLSQRGFEYYSPAICPSGFYVGPSCIVQNPRTGQGFPAITAGETAAYCVPNGHVCTSDTSDFRGGVWGMSRTASTNGAQVTVGPAIQIRWRAEDLDSLETDPLTPGPRSTDPPSQVLPTSTPESSASSVGPQTEAGLPSGPTSFSSSLRSSTLVRTVLPEPTESAPRGSQTSPSSSPPSTTREAQTSPPPPPSTSSQNGQKTSATPVVPVKEDADGRGGRSPRPDFTVVATVLLTILLVIFATYGWYCVLQRYRRYRAGEAKTFFVFEAQAWARRRLLRWRERWWRRGTTTATEQQDEEKAPARRRLPDAELGTEGPLPELGSTQPYGTMENPAELATAERWSWMSRVSRKLNVRGSAATVPPVPAPAP